MSPRNIPLAAGLAALLWAGAGNYAECAAQQQTTVQFDRAVQWHVRLKGTKA